MYYMSQLTQLIKIVQISQITQTVYIVGIRKIVCAKYVYLRAFGV